MFIEVVSNLNKLDYFLRWQFDKMILRNSVKGTIDHVADCVLLIRNSNQDLDCHRVNLIHLRHNDNSNNNGDDPTNSGDRSFYNIFKRGSRHYQF